MSPTETAVMMNTLRNSPTLIRPGATSQRAPWPSGTSTNAIANVWVNDRRRPLQHWLILWRSIVRLVHAATQQYSAMGETSTSSSRLFPPNPSLSPNQHTGSILLNAPPRNRSSSSASRGYSPARSVSGLSYNHPSPSISFAPLPLVPPELKRRSSITLGVAARSNLLKSQGSAAPNYANGQRTRDDVKTVMMTDEEWEAYKRRFESDAPPDLGDLAMKTGKKLWRKARGSFSSNASSSSNSSASNPAPNTPKAVDRRISETTTLPTIDSAPSSPSPSRRMITSLDDLDLDADCSSANALGLTAEEHDHTRFNEERKQKETKGEFGLVRAAEVDMDDEDEDEEGEEDEKRYKP